MDYQLFLQQKAIKCKASGINFPPAEISPVLYDFQRDVVLWALRLGRAAIFEDCGLGKTLQQLEWARHMSEYYDCPVLIVAPLSVNEQTIREGEKLGLNVKNVRSASELRQSGINITNYEMIHHFIGAQIGGIILDESSIMKSVDGKTRKLLLEHFIDIPYRLCCTATPCPNDIAEMANHAAFLGVMKRKEMLASFFVHDDNGWRLRGHAAKPFYLWLSSWSMAMKSPTDLGYEGSLFKLPPLTIHDVIVNTKFRRSGRLFPGALKGITDRALVRKQSVRDRCIKAAEIANSTTEQVIIWCGLNAESEEVSKLTTDCVEVKGTDSNEKKAESIIGFINGKYRVFVSKLKIAGFGLNLQHASLMVFLGMNDSYEAYYQGIRRSWRYGQKKHVHVYIIVTDHEVDIVENVRRKERASEKMSREIIKSTREYEMSELGMKSIDEEFQFYKPMTVPDWLGIA